MAAVITEVEDKVSGRARRAQIATQLQLAKLTEHDEVVLWQLANYNVLRGSQLMKLCYRDLSEGRADWLRRNRLGQLADLGILARSYIKGQGWVYWLDEGGIYWLEVQGHEARRVSPLLMRHDIAVADFMVAAIEEVERVGGSLEWEGVKETEIEMGIRPDATGRVQLADGRGLVFFLELDRASENRRFLDKKIARYVKHYKEGGWRVRYEREKYPPVLVVTTGGEARERLLRSVVATRLKLAEAEGAIGFYFTRMTDALTAGPLGARQWLTLAGGERQPFLKALVRGEG